MENSTKIKIAFGVIVALVIMVIIVFVLSQNAQPTQSNQPVQSAQPIQQSKTYCENEPISISCPDGKKLQIDQWQYYRPENATCGGVGAYPGCIGKDYTAKANSLIINNTFDKTDTPNMYFGEDPCSGISKQSDVKWRCI